jgi:8-oxo-dGTP pyrophosphatase MutT (NUDIX family)
VIRELGALVEVAVIKPRGRPVLALPKGHINPGETPESAACREVREETGLSAILDVRLGDVQYAYRFRGRTILKLVSFFLLRYSSGEIDNLEPSMRVEVDRASWLPLAEAAARLTYPGEREMAVKAAAVLAAR